jgi:putative oxidoreductase
VERAWRQLAGAAPHRTACWRWSIASRIASIFWMSGTDQGGRRGSTIKDSTYLLFREEYQAAASFRPEWAAPMATVWPNTCFRSCWYWDLFTRLSALALLGMTLVIQVFVYPDAWPTHLSWAALMLYLAGRGAGRLSLDHFLRLR